VKSHQSHAINENRKTAATTIGIYTAGLLFQIYTGITGNRHKAETTLPSRVQWWMKKIQGQWVFSLV